MPDHAPTTLPPIVACDVDGTLLRSDGTVGARTVAALDEVVDAGSELVYVTGRPPRWIAPIVDATGHRGIAICANGALVLDLDQDRVVRTSPFADAAAGAALARLREAIPGVLLGVEWEDGFAHEPDFTRGGARAGGDARQGPVVRGDEGLAARPVLKILARHLDHDRLGPAVVDALGSDATVTFSGGHELVEISAPGVDKAATLAWLARRRGHDAHDVLAFGDMPNDLAMLAWAGWAVAMGNADEQVLAVADEVTATNDEDGVAVVLERLLPA